MYQPATKRLKDHFGRKKCVVNVHMQERLTLNNAPNEVLVQVQPIFDHRNIHVRGLEEVGITSER